MNMEAWFWHDVERVKELEKNEAMTVGDDSILWAAEKIRELECIVEIKDVLIDLRNDELQQQEIEVLETVFAKFSKDGPSGLMFDQFELLRHIEKLKKEIK